MGPGRNYTDRRSSRDADSNRSSGADVDSGGAKSVVDQRHHPTPHLYEGKVYCAVVLGTFFRQVVGWSIGSSQTAALVADLALAPYALIAGAIFPIVGAAATTVTQLAQLAGLEPDPTSTDPPADASQVSSNVVKATPQVSAGPSATDPTSTDLSAGPSHISSNAAHATPEVGADSLATDPPRVSTVPKSSTETLTTKTTLVTPKDAPNCGADASIGADNRLRTAAEGAGTSGKSVAGGATGTRDTGKADGQGRVEGSSATARVADAGHRSGDGASSNRVPSTPGLTGGLGTAVTGSGAPAAAVSAGAGAGAGGGTGARKQMGPVGSTYSIARTGLHQVQG